MLIARAVAVACSALPATIGRGYAIVTLAADGRVVTDAAQAPAGTELEARLSRGRILAQVTGRRD